MANPNELPGRAALDAPTETGGKLPSNYRWVVVALLFFATTINYIDRQVLGILAETLEQEIGWSEAEYGFIVMSFQFAYALALLGFGFIVDRIGTKSGYALAVGWWSLAAMAHALARTPLGFAFARFGLGLGEAGNFPTAVKTVAEWFPKRERAFATGLFNSGSNIGAIAAPIVVPWLTVTYGWYEAFVVTGALGFIWVIAWLLMYRSPALHPRVSPEELAYINSDPPESEEKVSWLKLLKYRQTWAFAIGKMLTDPIWWFYLFWLPKYLQEGYGIQLTALAAPLVTVYLISDAGSIVGGWISSFLIKRGWSVNAGRKTAMLIMALGVTPMILSSFLDSMWGVILIVALAAASHQGWSANIFTFSSDMFPKRAVGSVVGIGGFAGAMGGMAFASVTGLWLEYSGGNYLPLFFVCGFAYLIALAIMHFMVPRLEPVTLD